MVMPSASFWTSPPHWRQDLEAGAIHLPRHSKGEPMTNEARDRDIFIPRANSPLRKLVQELNAEWEQLEAQKYVDAFIEGANKMKDFLGENTRNTMPYLDAVRLSEAVLCEDCKFITRIQTESCPMCGSINLTDLSKLIAPLDAITKEN
jgi:hypothetical protein